MKHDLSDLQLYIVTLNEEKKIKMVIMYKKDDQKKKEFIHLLLLYINKELVAKNLATVSLFKNELYHIDQAAKTNTYFVPKKYQGDIHLEFKFSNNEKIYINYAEAKTISKLIFDNTHPSTYSNELRESKNYDDEIIMELLTKYKTIEDL